MRKKSFFILLVFLLFFLLFFSGCIEQKDIIEKRRLCLELSSQSFATVPACSSQQSCFAAVETAFFGFDETAFSYSERQALSDYKNNIALSWLYYNNALKNINAIHAICFSATDLSTLPKQVNELNFNLSKAFESLDSAHKIVFGLLLLQQGILQKEEVSLAKEEIVFDDFALISSNLNVLSSQQKNPDDSLFAGKYLLLVFEFDSLSRKNGFSSVALNESSVFDLLGKNSVVVAKELSENKFLIPLLSDAVSGTITFFLNSFRLNGSVDALEQFPAFEFSQLFGKFAGKNSSLAEEFGKMQSQFALHRLELAKKNIEMKKTISTLFSSSSQRLEQLDSEYYYGFDQNLLSSLYSLLGQEETTVSSQRFSVSQISSFQEEAKKQLAELENLFSSILQEEYTGNISIGKKTSRLKQLFSSLTELNAAIDFYGEETVNSLDTLCSKRILANSDALSSIKLGENPPKELLDIKAKAEYYSLQFEKTTVQKNRLHYCRQAIESFNAFGIAKKDFEEYSVLLEAKTAGCSILLEAIFSGNSEIISEFLPQYKQFLAMKQKNNSISSTEEACLALKDTVIQKIHSDSTVKKIGENFSLSKKLLSELILLKKQFPKEMENVSTAFLEKKAEGLSVFFNNDSVIIPQKALPVLEELEKNTVSLLKETIEESQVTLSEYFKKNAIITVFPLESAFLEKTVPARVLVELRNPFGFLLPFPVHFSIPTSFNNGLLKNFSQNVTAAFFEKNTISASMKNLPIGNSFLEFDSNITAKAEEKQIVVFLSEELATIKKSFNFIIPFNIEKVFIETTAPDCCSVIEAFSIYKEKQFPATVIGKKISFSIMQAENNAMAELYYSVEKPLAVLVTLQKQAKTDSNKTLYFFSVKITNRLPFAVEEASVSLPLPFDEGILSAKLFDSTGKQEQLPNAAGKYFFKTTALLPNQSAQYFLELETTDTKAYWLSALQDQKEELSILSFSENSAIKTKAAGLLEKVVLLEQNFNPLDVEQTTQLLELLAETKELSILEKNNTQSLGQFLLEKNTVFAAIEKAEKQFSALNELKLFSDAAMLSLEISDAKQLLAEAESLANSSDLAAARKKLSEITKLLSQNQNTGLNALLLKQRDSLLKNNNFLLAESIQDSNAQKISEEIHSMDIKFLKAISENDSNTAISTLKQLKEKATDLNNTANASVSKTILETAGKILAFQQFLSKKGIIAKIEQLSSLFQSVSDNDLETANYALSFSRSFPEKALLEINNINSATLQKKIAEFNSLVEKKDFVKAFELSQSFLAELNSKLAELENIDTGISNAIAKIKEDATVAVNAAIELAQSIKDKELLQQAQLAKKEFEKGNFLKAISIAKPLAENNTIIQATTGFAGLSIKEIPLSIIPLVGIIIAALAVKNHREKKEEQKLRLQKLFRNQ